MRMLMPVDYALLVQRGGKDKIYQDAFLLTHFHVRIERLTDRLRSHFAIAPPVMRDEIVGYAGKNIVPVVQEVAFAITVTVDRISAITGRDELRRTHGARITAHELRQVHVFFASEPEGVA